MQKKQKCFAVALIIMLAAALLAGCGGARTETADEPTEFMVWQFAQGVVRPRVPRPNHAVFPRYSRKFIEKKDNNQYIVRAYVTTQDNENNNISFNFTVEAKYIGNDLFEELSLDIKRSQ